jgi:hypothetical protein
MKKKLCPKCTKTLDISCFDKSSKNTNGLQFWCKECCKVSKKNRYRLRRKEVGILSRKTALKTKYNMTPEQYKALEQKQNFVCAICKKQETVVSNPTNGTIDSLRVDHDHRCCSGEKSCGKCVRGLLCSECNLGLSKFKDSTSLLLEAIVYLIKTENVKFNQSDNQTPKQP